VQLLHVCVCVYVVPKKYQASRGLALPPSLPSLPPIPL
jgi:hypothetical protein